MDLLEWDLLEWEDCEAVLVGTWSSEEPAQYRSAPVPIGLRVVDGGRAEFNRDLAFSLPYRPGFPVLQNPEVLFLRRTGELIATFRVGCALIADGGSTLQVFRKVGDQPRAD